MADTYSEIYIHCVFAVKRRQSLLQKIWREQLFAYMAGIISENKQKAIIINGVEDHVHLLIGLVPDTNISWLVRDIKANSSRFINEQQWLPLRFEWQNGFGVFSYSKSDIDRVYKYIVNQEEHHRKKSFRDEYIELLQGAHDDPVKKFLFDELI